VPDAATDVAADVRFACVITALSQISTYKSE
jgi:hypothetical protein